MRNTAMEGPARPAVAVVIPCYNRASFLAEAIESVLHQTYPADEILVVDDGSTDNSGAIARSYPAVRCIEQRNQGGAVARNTGMNASTSELLVFLDSDDRLQPHALAVGVESLLANPGWAFVSGNVLIIGEDGSRKEVPKAKPLTGDPYIELLRTNHIWTPGCVMYRREVLDQVGGFSKWSGASTDYEINLRIARSFPFGRHDHVVLDYRVHTSNLSSNMRHMLRSGVRVRRAERRHASRSREAEQAWKDGMTKMRANYGAKLIQQLKRELVMAKRRGQALISVWYVICYYPEGVLRLIRGVFARATVHKG